MQTHSDVGKLLEDRYIGANVSQCAHTIMNGPTWPIWFSEGLGFSTNITHCKINDPQPAPDCSLAPYSDWATIVNSGHFSGWTIPDQTRSPQPWLRAMDNIWARDLISFVAQ